MTVAARETIAEDQASGQPEQRSAPRFTSLLRAAKLLCAKGEFVCLMRDISSSGVRVQCFHAIPADPAMALELPNGRIFEIEPVRGDGTDASFRFAEPVPLETLIQDAWPLKRRQLRLNIMLPVWLSTGRQRTQAVTHNMSRQGCCIETALPLALAQTVLLGVPRLRELRAKVRWRRDGRYGLVFEDTLSLRDFAIYTARLQCPALTA
jgi:hypothetical protein